MKAGGVCRRPSRDVRAVIRRLRTEGEELVEFDRLAGQIEVAPATLVRWARNGVGGRHLDAVKRGERWYTSYAAVARFLVRLRRGK